MADVNFFWCGVNFGFLEYIVIKSHIKVDHNVIIWLHGDKPNTKYWKEMETKITVKNADDIFDTTNFINNGGNFRTAADLWRFKLLYKIGGLYCDTDAFALRKFPDDEWIVCSGEQYQGLLSIGVLKAPAGHPIFLECFDNTKKKWGNVSVFSSVYLKYFGNLNPTHKNELFYPYNWKSYPELFKKKDIPSEAYSIHFYTNVIESYIKKNKKNILKYYIPLFREVPLKKIDIKWCEKNPNTLLGKLWTWVN